MSAFDPKRISQPTSGWSGSNTLAWKGIARNTVTRPVSEAALEPASPFGLVNRLASPHCPPLAIWGAIS